MKSERVSISCGEITLEGILHKPDSRPPYPAVVVCHPHPLYGGDMDNNVVVTICHELAMHSVAALRFNFRGVGNSQGTFGEGIKEREDVTAAVDYLNVQQDVDAQNLALAGYSFGGAVAFPVAQEDMRIKKLVLVSPALNGNQWEELRNYTRPKLVLFGDADTVVPYTRLRQIITTDKQFQIITGADHSWWGFEEEMGNKIIDFMR